MGGVVDVDLATEDVLGFEGFEELVDALGVTGDHRGGGGVDHCDGEGAFEGLESLADLIHGEFHHRHAASAGEPFDQLGASHHDTSCVGKGERAGDHCGAHLSLAVPHHRSGVKAEGAPKRREGDGHGKERRLNHIDPVEGGHVLAFIAPKNACDGPPGQGLQGFIAFCDRAGEHRGLVEEVASHCGPLTALPGNHKDHPAPLLGGSLQQLSMGEPLGEGLERLGGAGGVGH